MPEIKVFDNDRYSVDGVLVDRVTSILSYFMTHGERQAFDRHWRATFRGSMVHAILAHIDDETLRDTGQCAKYAGEWIGNSFFPDDREMQDAVFVRVFAASCFARETDMRSVGSEVRVAASEPVAYAGTIDKLAICCLPEVGDACVLIDWKPRITAFTPLQLAAYAGASGENRLRVAVVLGEGSYTYKVYDDVTPKEGSASYRQDIATFYAMARTYRWLQNRGRKFEYVENEGE